IVEQGQALLIFHASEIGEREHDGRTEREARQDDVEPVADNEFGLPEQLKPLSGGSPLFGPGEVADQIAKILRSWIWACIDAVFTRAESGVPVESQRCTANHFRFDAIAAQQSRSVIVSGSGRRATAPDPLQVPAFKVAEVDAREHDWARYLRRLAA